MIGVVDLRSDTVTTPTAAMRAAMAAAEVGDDAYGEDPTVRRLEEAVAAELGTAAALWVPSGTMGNLVALAVQARPGDLVVAAARSHVALHEHGAAAALLGVQFVTVPDASGEVDPADVAATAALHTHAGSRVGVVAVENTHMASGGTPVAPAGVAALVAAAIAGGAGVHVDGARLWNAAVAGGCAPEALLVGARTVSCCLSKGLGAPVGSVVAGSGDDMAAARALRQRLGGQLRQVGVLAAAGLVALDGWRARLAADHRRALRLAEAAAERWQACADLPKAVRTNIVCLPHQDPPALLAHLQGWGVRAGVSEPGVVRLVTHHQIDDDAVDLACRAIAATP